MMRAKKLPNGNLLVPSSAEGEGGLMGDGVLEVEPGSPEYREWLSFVERESTSAADKGRKIVRKKR